MAEYPAHLIVRRRLRDGRTVTIRPIRADDDLLEREFVQRLSGETRYVADAGGENCELGIVIADAWQKSGIAGLLMVALLGAARARPEAHGRRGVQHQPGDAALRARPGFRDSAGARGPDDGPDRQNPLSVRRAG